MPTLLQEQFDRLVAFPPTHLLAQYGSGIYAAMTSNSWEGAVYLGLANLAFLSWALIRKKGNPSDRKALNYSLGGMIFFAVIAGGEALHVGGHVTPIHLPGVILDKLPLFANVRTPARAIVFAYHTDSQGLYRSVPDQMWRLKGWARTSPTGDFEFRTIRPAPYPGRNVPAHIHMTIEGPGIARQSSGIQFADDSLVTAADRAAGREAGRFSDLAVVETREGVQHCSMLFRATGKNVF